MSDFKAVMANVSGELQKPASFSVTSTGSTTARSLADRFSEVVNVLDFGADPTGTSDSTAAILLAVAALPSGGTIYFPAGTYLKDANFVAVNNISFEGEDRAMCILKARSVLNLGGGAIIHVFGNNLTCRNLTFDCNWQNLRQHQNSIGAISLNGYNCTVSNCRVINFGGSNTASPPVESFPLVISGWGARIENNIVEQPVVGIRSNGELEDQPYATFISLFSVIQGSQTQVRQTIVSSDASANTINANIAYPNGTKVMFDQLVGGSPLAISTEYYVVRGEGVTGNNFQLSTTLGGSPVDFDVITSGRIGSLTTGGSGWIQNNNIVGAFPEGTQTSEFSDGSIGIVGGSGFDTLFISGNNITNIGSGINGDSWTNGQLIVEGNFFRNCQRGVNINFLLLSADPKIEYLRIEKNIFRLTANGNIGGGAARITNAKNVVISSNYLDTYDYTTSTGIAFFVSECNVVEVKDNLIHTNLVIGEALFGSNVKCYKSSNNRDQNGVQRFEYNRRDRSCLVDGNRSALENGLALGRAIFESSLSQPLGSARSATNRFIIYVNAGEYDLSGYAATETTIQSHVSIVGTSERSNTRIKNSSATTFSIPNTSENVTLKNITVVAADGRIALNESNHSSTVIENVIFDKEGTGVLVPAGANAHLGKFINCYSVHPFHGSNNQGVFGGECYDCQWLGGFSTWYSSGSSPLFRNCIIVGRLWTLVAASNLKLENCRISAETGTSNQNMLLGSNCLITNSVFKNVRLVFSGSDNEVYNCTFGVDAGQSNCIAEASGQTASVKIFNVGSNKPVDTNLTITSLDQYNLTNVLSGSGAPSASAPNGSIYLRTDGDPSSTVYVRAGDQWRPLGAYEP
jgi:hypothetical protein